MSLRVQRRRKAASRRVVERRNRKDSAITSLRYRSARNDKCLVGHDMT